MPLYFFQINLFQIIFWLDSFSPFLNYVWDFIKAWWWVPLPFILWPKFKFYWLWSRNEKWYAAKIKPILLEIKIPKEVLKPIRSMEMVLQALWQIFYQPPDWWEKWIDGQFQLSFSLEIVSLGGEPHFYIRIPENTKDPVEATIYSQYPDIEIFQVEDYVKKVPQDIPNKKWNMWGADYRLLKEDPYPIKTYLQFETEHEAKEEKRIDPLSLLLESMAKIKPGEQLWIQINLKPVTDQERPWVTEGKKIRDQLAKREKKKSGGWISSISEVLRALISGKGVSKEGKKEEVFPPEIKLTPGEREIINRVEGKIAKAGFETYIRFIYLGKREVYFQSNLRLAFTFFSAFSTQNCNSLVPWGETITKIHKSWWLLPNLILDRRLYVRKRQLFRRYINRVSPKFPKSGGTFILNIEELATIFHFPGRSMAPAPSMPRIESKKGEAPPGLPIKQ